MGGGLPEAEGSGPLGAPAAPAPGAGGLRGCGAAGRPQPGSSRTAFLKTLRAGGYARHYCWGRGSPLESAGAAGED